MRIELSTARDPASREVSLRALLFNDSYAPVTISRTAFVGPSVEGLAGGLPRPASVEAGFGGPSEPIRLQPFTFYGRERSFDLEPGTYEVSASYEPPDGEPIRERLTVTVEPEGE